MKLWRQTRNREIKLFRCLCDHCQFGNSGGPVAPINLESVPLGIGLSNRHHSLANLVDHLQARDIPGERFRGRFMRPTVKSEWCRSGRVEVEHIPDLNIRQTKMHGNHLKQPVSRIEYQRIHSSFFYLSWQMLQCRLNQARRQIPGRVSHHVQALQLRYPAPGFGYRTWWVFIFAKRYEVQIGCANNGFNIRNSNKHNFMSSRLQLACKCSHRIQMAGQR